MKKIVIASACRTAIGKFGGTLANVPAAELGSIWLICALLQRRRDLIIKLFPARRRTPQVHYAPRH